MKFGEIWVDFMTVIINSFKCQIFLSKCTKTRIIIIIGFEFNLYSVSTNQVCESTGYKEYAHMLRSNICLIRCRIMLCPIKIFIMWIEITRVRCYKMFEKYSRNNVYNLSNFWRFWVFEHPMIMDDEVCGRYMSILVRYVVSARQIYHIPHSVFE